MSACAPAQQTSFYAADQYPDKLSAWGMLAQEGQQRLTLASDNATYALNTALFSDYAKKLRTVHLPPGTSAAFHPTDAFHFPVGTVISKTFWYATTENGVVDLKRNGPEALAANAHLDLSQARLIETRLLVKQEHGWDALPYIWQGDDAYLAITGDLLELPLADGNTLNYLVPSRNQCASCHAYDHTSGELEPIGMRARHLNRRHPAMHANQLQAWSDQGWLTGLPPAADIAANAMLTEGEATLAHRARSYLDINCGHCHNPNGAADTSGLLLDYPVHNQSVDTTSAKNTNAMTALGQCKPPIAAGQGSGGRLYSIVPGRPAESIMTFRMESTKPNQMMPELGRSLAHREGSQLISDWIASLSGTCL